MNSFYYCDCLNCFNAFIVAHKLSECPMCHSSIHLSQDELSDRLDVDTIVRVYDSY